MKTKTIAVLLAGCGHIDGTEIREAVCALVSLDRHIQGKNITVKLMAPNRDQFHVMNHLTRQEIPGEHRNMLVEAARIARGQIVDLAQVDPQTLDALVMPGGFGAAKNLCDYAFKGASGTVDDLVAKLIRSLFTHKKPIGAICIAPAIVAMVLGREGIEVTLGDQDEVAQEVEKTGARHFKTKPGEIHFDQKNKIISTPAYMHDNAHLYQIADGIDLCIQKVISSLF